MAKIILLILFAITVAAEAAPLPAKWTAANKSFSDMDKKMQMAFNGVNAAATPDKKKEALEATIMQALTVGITLAKAKDTGDEKKVVKIASSYEFASDMVIKAPPAEKLRVMEDTFNAVAAPDPTECPNIDKSFCETSSKTSKACRGVISATPPGKKEQVMEAVLKQKYVTERTINKAYAEDEKKIPGILVAYSKAADAVIAAAPTEKLKVMEEAFTAAPAHLGA